MSRRSRRRGNAGGAGWLGKAALGLILVAVLGAGILYAVIRSYLHSDGFRKFLAREVGDAAQVSGEFTPFRWDGLAVATSGFEATGAGVVRELKVESLRTEVGVGGLGRGVWEIQGSRIQRLEVSIDARKDEGSPVPVMEPAVSEPRVEKKKKAKGWLPTEIELQGLDVREVVVRAWMKQGPASVTGMKVRMEPAGGRKAYLVELADGAIVLPFDLIPTIRLDRAKLRYQDGVVFLNRAEAAAWKEGWLDAAGEWDSRTGGYVLEGNVGGVKCEELFNETWAKRFIGDAETDFTLGNAGGSPVASGRLTVRNGTLTALPVLEALAAYADTRRFRVLPLTEAGTDWRWQDGEWLLTDLVLASEGLVRLEGAMTIRGEALDGSFRLGLAPGTLARIPGAETDVFSPGERGLVWAPVRVTGTVDDPKEDLTGRLIEAAGLRMFDVIPGSGERVIKFSRSLLGEDSSKAVEKGLEKGREILEKNPGIVEEVGGILEGFLGGGSGRKKEDR